MLHTRLLIYTLCLALGILGWGVVPATPTSAQEVFAPTTPIAQPAIAQYRIKEVRIYPTANTLAVVFEAVQGGTLVTKEYNAQTNPTGATRLNQINNCACNVTSMMKRIFTAAVADGVLPAGAVSGTPQD